MIFPTRNEVLSRVGHSWTSADDIYQQLMRKHGLDTLRRRVIKAVTLQPFRLSSHMIHYGLTRGYTQGILERKEQGRDYLYRLSQQSPQAGDSRPAEQSQSLREDSQPAEPLNA